MSCYLFFKVKASMALSVKSNSLFYQAQRCCLQGPMGYTRHFRTQGPRELNVSLFKAITRLFCLMLRDVTAGLVVSLPYALVEKMRFSCSVLRLGSCKMGKAEVGNIIPFPPGSCPPPNTLSLRCQLCTDLSWDNSILLTGKLSWGLTHLFHLGFSCISFHRLNGWWWISHSNLRIP